MYSTSFDTTLMPRKQLSPEELKKRQNERHNKRYHQRILEMSPDELTQLRLREKAKRDRYLSKRTPEQKIQSNEKAKNHMRNLRAAWTDERKQADKEWHRQWREKTICPDWIEKERARGRENKRLLKDKIIRYYSNGEMRCVCPTCEVPGGAKNFDSLTIDHINGGGRKHDAELRANGDKGGLYRWLLRNNFPIGFQVYCWVCNNKKRMTNNENRHRDFNRMSPAEKKSYEKHKLIRMQEKEQVIRFYSHGLMRCMNPDCEVPGGVKDLDGLTIDHIYGGGKRHIQQLRNQGVKTRFYTWLIKNNFPNPELYQVLCWNCQNRKRKNNSEDHYALKGVRGTQHLPKAKEGLPNGSV